MCAAHWGRGQRLKYSSPGYDNIDSKVLKLFHPYTVKLLIHNVSFNNGVVPLELKISRITPIHKEDDPAVFNHYRPISVLPTLSKVLEKLVPNRLNQFIENNNILYSNQYGFRKKEFHCYGSLSGNDWSIQSQRS